jgi:hypothetical protein
VRAPGLEWNGASTSILAIERPRVEARVEVGPAAWWARFPRVLSYRTAFGTVRWRDDAGESTGVALLERAWGADVPFDVAAFAPRRWQWDVLTTAAGDVHAALRVGSVGMRTMSRVASSPRVSTGYDVRLRVRDWRSEEGRSVPATWEGVLRTRAGLLRYEARASTPVAPMVPDGGFVGTTWTGEWNGHPVAGTGFTEYRAASKP